METVVIVIHLMVIVALIAVVLLQRSEGGALGIGGANAFMTTRGQGNVLTRATGILAAAFFITSIALTVLTRLAAPPSAILDTAPAASTTTTAPANTANGTAGSGSATAPATGGGVANELNQFLQQRSGAPAAGTTTTPPATSGTAPADNSAAPAPSVPTSQ